MDKKEVTQFLLATLEDLKELIEESETYIKDAKVNNKGYIKELNSVKMLSRLDLFTYKSKLLFNSKSPDEKLLINFSIGYLIKTNSLDFNEKAFEELYHELKILIDEGKYIFRTVALICGCEVEDEIECDPIKIMPSNKEYINVLINNWNPFTGFMKPDIQLLFKKLVFLESNALLVCERKSNEFNHDSLDIRKNVNDLVKTIVLTNGVKNEFFISPAYTFSYLHDSVLTPIEHIYTYNNKPYEQYMTFSLEKDAICKYYSIIKGTEENLLALNRLTDALSKLSLEDKYIDLAIALESLFSTVQSEVVFRISLYTGVLHDDKEIYKCMKKLYSYRSKIVHGGNAGKVNENLDKLDKIVRKTIMIILQYSLEGKGLKDVEEIVENKIFQSLT